VRRALSPARVLLAHGDRASRVAMAAGLRALGLQVTQSEDGPGTLERAASASPDLIVASVELPRLGGVELVWALRTDPRCHSIPILMVGSNWTEGTVAACLEAGADEVVSLDRLDAEFGARVRSLLRTSLLARQLRREREWLDAALGVARATADSPELEQVLAVVVRAVGDRLGAARCSLLLVDPASTPGRATLVADRDESLEDGLPIELCKYPELAAALERRDLVLIDDAATSDFLPETAREALGRQHIRSLLVIPLVSHGEGVGAIFLRIARARAFAEEDLDFCRLVAAAAANAVHSAWLYRRSHRQRAEISTARDGQERDLLAANATLLHVLRAQQSSLSDEDLLSGEPFFMEKLAAALGHMAADPRPVAAVALHDRSLARRSPADAAGAVAELVVAARSLLPPGGHAVLLSADRVGLVFPAYDAVSARAAVRGLLASFPDLDMGVAAAVPGEPPPGPQALFAAAEASAGDATLPRILVIEEDRTLVEVLHRFLSGATRFEVVRARSAADALEKARQRPPDVALLDLELPGMDGAEVLSRLRRAVGEIPALACGNRREVASAASGFDGFLEKPLDASALVAQVQHLLRLRG